MLSMPSVPAIAAGGGITPPASSARASHSLDRPWVERHWRALLLGLFPAIISALLGVVYQGMTLSNDIRAYVGGESLWSKGQKESVQYLYRFTMTHDEADYRQYMDALVVSLADRQARLNLQLPHPNVDAAAKWFIVGQNHPEEARDMALFFLRFGGISYMQQAINIWTQGDRDIDSLLKVGREIHAFVASGVHDSTQARVLMNRLDAVDNRLTILEANFSGTLGEGARWMRHVILLVSLLVGALLMWIGTTITRRLLHHARTAAEVGRRHEEEFQALVEHAPDLIIRFDRKFRFIYVNPTATRLTGMPGLAFLGKTIEDLGFPTEIVARWHQSLSHVVNTGEDRQMECECPTLTGPRSYHVRFTAERDANGTIESVFAIGRDMSDLKASEQALRDREEQLRQAQKMEAIGRLAGGIAHDFNNLLTVIQASLDISLRESSSLGAFNTNLLQDARNAAERAEGLTRQLLTFSRQQVLQPKIFRLDSAVTEIQRLLVRLIGEDIQLVTEFDPSMPFIEADPGQVGQIILNLAINAREAMPHGGTLKIRTSNETHTPRPISGGPNEGSVATSWAVLEVSDTGIGMDDVTRARIFEPFFTTRGDRRGTGLGLSVVYGIVSQSGGHIDVHSNVGVGTTFRIVFPICQALGAVATEAPPVPLERGSEAILVVEDEASVRSLVRGVLREQGYTVITASNGEEAIQWMEQQGDVQKISLMISDVVMPLMGGRELVRELSRRGFEFPVIFMSGYTNDPTPLQDMFGERAIFLAKPFNIHRLCEVVRQTLDDAHRTSEVLA